MDSEFPSASSGRSAFLGRVLEGAVIAITVALATLVIVGVASRKAGFSLVWYDEVAAILLAWLTYYGAALAALRRAHLGFPNLVRRAPLPARRTLVVFRETAVIGFFALTAWLGVGLMNAVSGTFLVSLPWLPAQIVYSAIPIGATLFIVAELTAAIEDWKGNATP